MFTKFFLSTLLVITQCTPVLAQSAKFARPEIVESQDSKGNYVINPSGFKNALNITTSSATIAQDVTGATDLLDGVASLVCDASAQNGYCQWTSKTIQEGDKTGNCEAKAVFKGDASLYKLEVYDGSSVVASSSVLPSVTDWTSVSVNYPCGATRNIRFTQTEAGTGAAVNIGRVYWGLATNLGTANSITDWAAYTTNCSSTWVSNATHTCFERRVGDEAEFRIKIVLTGAPTSTSLTINLPRTIDTTKLNSTPGSTNQNVGVGMVLDSGTNNHPLGVWVTTSTSVSPSVFNTSSTYGSGAFVTQAVPITFASGDEVYITFKVPIVGWGAQAVVSQGSQIIPTIQKFTSGSGTYTKPAGVLYLRVRGMGAGAGGSGSGTSGSGGIGSAGTGSTTFGTSLLTATSAAAGSVSYETGAAGTGTISSPAYGTVFQGNRGGPGTAHGAADATLYLPGGIGGAGMFGGAGTAGLLNASIAAAANSGSGGGGGAASNVTGSTGGAGGSSGGGFDAIIPNPSSTYSYNISTGGSGGGAGTSGIAGQAGADGYLEVTEYYSTSTPMLVGSVTSNSSGLERIERAKLNCDAGSAITSQSGSWVSSIGNIASGACAVVVASGIFSSTPTCTATLNQAIGTFTAGTQVLPTSATAFSVGCTYLNNGSSTVNNCTSSDFDVVCIGPR